MSGDLEAVLGLIDEANAADPNLIETGAGARPTTLAYGERMSARLAMDRR